MTIPEAADVVAKLSTLFSSAFVFKIHHLTKQDQTNRMTKRPRPSVDRHLAVQKELQQSLLFDISYKQQL